MICDDCTNIAPLDIHWRGYVIIVIRKDSFIGGEVHDKLPQDLPKV